MRLSARARRLERVLGAPTADELFEQAYAKYSRNVERVFSGSANREEEEPLTPAETAALRSRGIDGLVTWLWYGVDDADLVEPTVEAAK